MCIRDRHGTDCQRQLYKQQLSTTLRRDLMTGAQVWTFKPSFTSTTIQVTSYKLSSRFCIIDVISGADRNISTENITSKNRMRAIISTISRRLQNILRICVRNNNVRCLYFYLSHVRLLPSFVGLCYTSQQLRHLAADKA